MKKIILILFSMLIAHGCVTSDKKPTTAVFDSGAYGKFSESELASISGYDGDNDYVRIVKINGKETNESWLESSPDIIKIPPGKHHIEVYFRHSEFLSLRPSTEFYKNIVINVEKSNNYVIYISEKRFGVIGSQIEGWIENKSTGEKVGIF